MNAGKLPSGLEDLIRELTQLPTVGRKSAQRLAIHLLKQPPASLMRFATALTNLHQQVGFCEQCGFFAEGGQLCRVCNDPARDHGTILVVEEPTDVLSFEQGGHYRGVYQVLMGRIDPLGGVTVEDLRIDSLVSRVGCNAARVSEVILATSADVEGDATAMYLARLLEASQVKVSRIGLGISAGSSLEYADQLTLQRALEGRR